MPRFAAIGGDQHAAAPVRVREDLHQIPFSRRQVLQRQRHRLGVRRRIRPRPAIAEDESVATIRNALVHETAVEAGGLRREGNAICGCEWKRPRERDAVDGLPLRRIGVDECALRAELRAGGVHRFGRPADRHRRRLANPEVDGLRRGRLVRVGHDRHRAGIDPVGEIGDVERSRRGALALERGHVRRIGQGVENRIRGSRDPFVVGSHLYARKRDRRRRAVRRDGNRPDRRRNDRRRRLADPEGDGLRRGGLVLVCRDRHRAGVFAVRETGDRELRGRAGLARKRGYGRRVVERVGDGIGICALTGIVRPQHDAREKNRRRRFVRRGGDRADLRLDDDRHAARAEIAHLDGIDAVVSVGGDGERLGRIGRREGAGQNAAAGPAVAIDLDEIRIPVRLLDPDMGLAVAVVVAVTEDLDKVVVSGREVLERNRLVALVRPPAAVQEFIVSAGDAARSRRAGGLVVRPGNVARDVRVVVPGSRERNAIDRAGRGRIRILECAVRANGAVVGRQRARVPRLGHREVEQRHEFLVVRRRDGHAAGMRAEGDIGDHKRSPSARLSGKRARLRPAVELVVDRIGRHGVRVRIPSEGNAEDRYRRRARAVRVRGGLGVAEGRIGRLRLSGGNREILVHRVRDGGTPEIGIGEELRMEAESHGIVSAVSALAVAGLVGH